MEITVKLTEKERIKVFADILANIIATNFFEGYGIQLNYAQNHFDSARRKVVKKIKNHTIEDIWMQILADGNELIFEDVEGEGAETKSITIKDFERIDKLPIKALMEVLDEENGDPDAYTYDTLLQHLLYGKEIFA